MYWCNSICIDAIDVICIDVIKFVHNSFMIVLSFYVSVSLPIYFARNYQVESWSIKYKILITSIWREISWDFTVRDFDDFFVYKLRGRVRWLI